MTAGRKLLRSKPGRAAIHRAERLDTLKNYG
jgi:hypothetical protein